MSGIATSGCTLLAMETKVTGRGEKRAYNGDRPVAPTPEGGSETRPYKTSGEGGRQETLDPRFRGDDRV